MLRAGGWVGKGSYQNTTVVHIPGFKMQKPVTIIITRKKNSFNTDVYCSKTSSISNRYTTIFL